MEDMKQHITPEDWGTFERNNPDAARRAREYYSNWQQEYIKEHYPNQFVTMDWWPINMFFNIGQMIEFLDENQKRIELESPDYSPTNPDIYSPNKDLWYLNGLYKLELCDALWEAVKEAL